MSEARARVHRGRPPVEASARPVLRRYVAITVVGFIASVALASCGRATISGNGGLGSAASPPTTRGSTVTQPAGPAATVSLHGVTVTSATDLHVAPGVSCTASGPVTHLLYKDLINGAGPAAAPTSTVTAQYVGVLYRDGTKFDSTWDRGPPAQFALRQALPGFAESVGGTGGVPPMRVGGRRIMILPARLAYGSRSPGRIPPNSTLVFVVDLVDTT